MGQCHGKNIAVTGEDEDQMPPKPSSVPTSRRATPRHQKNSAPATPTQYQHQSSNATWPSPYPTSGATGSPLPAGVSPSPARSTPRRFFKRPFPPPSPAKHIKASIVKRFGPQRPKEGPIPEEGTGELLIRISGLVRILSPSTNWGRKLDGDILVILARRQ
jgi:hypothetical protein